MKTRSIVFAALFFSLPQLQAEDIEAGKEIAMEMCQGCHGVDGNSPGTGLPKLAGQTVNYLRGQLGFFRAGVLGHATMRNVAVDLKDDELANVAAYYASLPLARPENIDLSLVEEGKGVYEEKCIKCHGADAQTAASPSIPILASQKPEYTFNQLKAFKDGDRKFPWMRHAVRNLDEAEMKAVAHYVATKP